MSPHETLFRLEATQNLERAIVDHTPLCRFTVWDFPGDYYGEDDENNSVFECVAASSLIFVGFLFSDLLFLALWNVAP